VTPQRKPKGAAALPAKQLDAFIAKFDPVVARVIRACRAKLRERMPTANEIVYDNYNYFVIGYSASERPSDCIVSLAAAANGVGLSFYYGSSLDDPDGILQGSGRQNRFVRLPSAATLDHPAVARLIGQAIARAKTPLPESGRGRTIIKSVSARQRPRRARKRSKPTPRRRR
jgi:hypothetical protein